MRDIIFRAKVLSHFAKEAPGNTGWVYGELHLKTPVPHIHYDLGKRLPIDVATIGQFTGLYDRTGKQIFEGDILNYVDSYNYPNGRMGQIEWNRGGFVFHENFIHGVTSVRNINLDVFTIIGNIYDNPELEIKH